MEKTLKNQGKLLYEMKYTKNLSKLKFKLD